MDCGNWWESYGDIQLNELINKALKESPNMAIAIARLHKSRFIYSNCKSFKTSTSKRKCKLRNKS